ncbi:MAG TPA: hypothetical protein VFI41_07170 [Gemmatimonadales bacterium]|nr:hypothetical protein [Gemmatimonadales bacterium]
MQHEQGQPKAEGRVSRSEEAPDVITHEVADEQISEDRLEVRSNLHPKPMMPDIIDEEGAAAISFAPDAESANLPQCERFKVALHRVHEQEPEVRTRFVMDLLQILIQERHLARIQDACIVMDALSCSFG